MKERIKRRSLSKLLLLLMYLGLCENSIAQKYETICSFSGKNTVSDWIFNETSQNGNYYVLFQNNFIETPVIDFDKYSSIEVTVNARTYGGTSGNSDVLVCSIEDYKSTTTIINNSLKNYNIAFESIPHNGRLKFYSMAPAGVTKGLGVAAITVKGIPLFKEPIDPQFSFSKLDDIINDQAGTYKNELKTDTDGKIKYSIVTTPADGVASINVETGEITVIGSGKATVTAGSEATAEYNEAKASYDLTILKSPTVSFESSIIEKNISNTSTFVNPINAYEGAIVVFSSSDAKVATVDSEGNVTPLRSGRTIINAIIEPIGMWDGAQSSYQVVIRDNKIIAEYPYILSSFQDYLEDWNEFDLSGSKAYWKKNSSAAEISSDKESNQDWLISPEYKLTKPFVYFNFTSSAKGSDNQLKLKYSFDFDGIGDPSQFNWIDVTSETKWPTGYSSSKKTVASDTIKVERGNACKIHFAFVHEIDDQKSTLWSISKVSVRDIVKPAFKFTSANVTADINDLTVSNPIITNSKGSISFISSDNGVASVDNDGNISLNAIGSAKIKAVLTETEIYESAKDSFTLNVREYGTIVNGNFDAELTGWSVEKGIGTVVIDNATETGNYVKITSGSNQSNISQKVDIKTNHTYEYSYQYKHYNADGDGVKDVSKNGGTYIQGTGVSAISSLAESSEWNTQKHEFHSGNNTSFTFNIRVYKTNNEFYLDNVTLIDKGQTKPLPELSFAENEVTKHLYDDGAYKNQITSKSDGIISYVSSQTSVAEVDGQGFITIKDAGTTSIKATIAETDAYRSESKEYRLIVVAPQLSVTNGSELANITSNNGENKEIKVKLKGSNIKTPIYLSLNGDNVFDLDNGCSVIEETESGSLEKEIIINILSETSGMHITKLVATDKKSLNFEFDLKCFSIDSTRGTYANPASVDEVIYNVFPAGKEIYIRGFIVGSSANNNKKANTAINSNFALSAEKDGVDIVPIGLPDNGVREIWKPTISSNINKEVIVYGKLESYFSAYGFKSTGLKDIILITDDEPALTTDCKKSDFENKSSLIFSGIWNNTNIKALKETINSIEDKSKIYKADLRHVAKTDATDIRDMFNGCNNLTEIYLSSTPSSNAKDFRFTGISENCLVYYTKDVVSGANSNTVFTKDEKYYAPLLILTDNSAFNCSEVIETEEIVYTRDFGQKRTGSYENGDGYGWETIVLPFTPNHITARTAEESCEEIFTLKPFGKSGEDGFFDESSDYDWDNFRPFWLREHKGGDYVDVSRIEPERPYIIAMTNNPGYSPTYNLVSDFTFKAIKTNLNKTDESIVSGSFEVDGITYAMFSTYRELERNSDLYAINEIGDAFINTMSDNGRTIKPFESYLKIINRPAGMSAPRSLSMSMRPDISTGIIDRLCNKRNIKHSVDTYVYKGEIIIMSDKSKTVNIYSSVGILVKKVEVESGTNIVSGLPNGIYIVEGTKIVL